MKIGRFAFLRPPLGGFGATYGDHLRLIGKRVVDFLLALISVFTQRNFVADFLQAKCIFNENRQFCVSEAPFEGLRGNVRRSS